MIEHASKTKLLRDVYNAPVQNVFTHSITASKTTSTNFTTVTLDNYSMGAYFWCDQDFLLKVNDDSAEFMIPANMLFHLPIKIQKFSVKQVSVSGTVYMSGWY